MGIFLSKHTTCNSCGHKHGCKLKCSKICSYKNINDLCDCNKKNIKYNVVTDMNPLNYPKIHNFTCDNCVVYCQCNTLVISTKQSLDCFGNTCKCGKCKMK